MRVNLFGVMVGQPARRAPHGRARRRLDRQHHVDRRDQRRRRADDVPRREGRGHPLHAGRIAIDLAEHGIRVNCIAPAHIPTGINATYDQSARSCGSCSRSSAMGSPADVANAVLYLASDRAAQVTGIVLPVDGGTTAGPAGRTSSRTSLRGRREEAAMPADLVIRGGTVFDGSGAPGRVADVAIADGVIREIGPNLRGERELDASGCAVAPGFIDIHTHYDAQVFWDPALRPSSYHGVTTVVAGNCGFTIAPTRPEHHDVIVRTLENVEDMDPATLTAGIAWDFETFPEYLESVRRRGTVLNFTAYVGHSALRLYVMGDAAYERAATADEIERMCRARARGDRRGRGRVLDQLLVRAPRRRRQARPEPLRRARRGRGAVPAPRARRARAWCSSRRASSARYADVYEWQPRVGRPFTYPLFAAPGRQAPRRRSRCTRRASRAARRSGRRSRRGRSRCSSRWPTPYSLNTGKVFGELLQGEPRRCASPRTAIRPGGRGRRPTWSSRR